MRRSTRQRTLTPAGIQIAAANRAKVALAAKRAETKQLTKSLDTLVKTFSSVQLGSSDSMDVDDS